MRYAGQPYGAFTEMVTVSVLPPMVIMTGTVSLVVTPAGIVVLI